MLLHRFSEQRRHKGLAIGVDTLFGSPPSPTLAAKIFSIGAHEQKSGDCANELAVMYETGFQLNLPRPERAVNLYERAINVSLDAGAMNNLVFQLVTGMEGVEADVGDCTSAQSIKVTFVQ